MKPPNLLPRVFIGKRKFQDVVEAPQTGLINVFLKIGREHDQSLILLHSLQQKIDLDVGVAIMGILDLCAFAEQGIALIKEQEALAEFGFAKNLAEPALSFSNVFADHRGEINLKKVERKLIGQHFGGKGFACSGG